MTTIKSANLVKTGLVGFIAAASLGLLISPVKADEINQDAVQTSIQEGNNNTSVNQSTQNAKIRENRVRVGRGGHEELSEKNIINQGTDQLGDQFGDNNTSVNQSENNATIEKNTRDIRVRRDRSGFHR